MSASGTVSDLAAASKGLQAPIGASPTGAMTGALGGPLTAEQDDINTGRIWRLGKKLTDIDGDMHSQFESLRKEIEMLSERTNMITTFLPRRLRRMVERILSLETKDKDKEAEGKEKEATSKKKDDQKKHVAFSEKEPEVQTFTIEAEKERLPWQYIGEPDQKWNWCLQPRNEMGRDLARYFEQLEHEREEVDESIASQVKQLRQEMLLRIQNFQGGGGGGAGPRDSLTSTAGPSSPSPPSSPRLPGRRSVETQGGDWGNERSSVVSTMGPMPSEGMDKIARRMEKVVLPQLGTLEDRVDRLAKDLADVRKLQDSDHQKKVDKDEFQLVKMRLAPFERFDPKQVAAQLETVEVEGKHCLHLMDQVNEQVRKIEGYSAHRTDVTKARADVTAVRSELHKIQAEQKEISSSIFHSNRQMSTIVLDAKTSMEKGIAKLETEKVPVTEYVSLQEKVSKLEGSMRDNRQILSDSGSGTEVSQIVKRIILNMEDKIILLEKKVATILDGGTSEANQGPDAETSKPTTAGRPVSTGDGVTQGMTVEFKIMSQAVVQLKQDINLSKVNMEQIHEQQVQAAEMAARLQISVEDGDVGTTLSLSRVQVMVAAAARQLVAGSKWVTQEVFDHRFAELQKELQGFAREVQGQIQDVQARGPTNPNIGSKKLPNLAKKLPHEQEDSWGAALEKAGDRLGMPKTRPNQTHMMAATAPLSGAKQWPHNAPASARTTYR